MLKTFGRIYLTNGLNTGDATALLTDIRQGKSAYAKGEKVVGTLDLSNLTAENLKNNVTIDGVTGTLQPKVYATGSLSSVPCTGNVEYRYFTLPFSALILILSVVGEVNYDGWYAYNKSLIQYGGLKFVHYTGSNSDVPFNVSGSTSITASFPTYYGGYGYRYNSITYQAWG